MTLRQAFQRIEQASNYKVQYNSSQVDVSRQVNLKDGKADVKNLLNSLLNGTGCTYTMHGNYIIVEKEKKSTSPQQSKKRVSGVIKDENGEPIIGATVKEKGSQNGAITDADGRFSFEAAPGSTLQVTYVGYKPQEIKANDNISLNMATENETLNEVVVVGYGTQKKIDLTGSVAQIGSKELTSRPVANLSAGLQGLMPGITVTGTNGAPGLDGGSIRVRGVGTLNNASPYILVDGVETGNLSAIDPQDIASISVLKDAASAAIYGSKASNGVILITTKRGESGKPKVSYNGYFGLQNVTSLVDRLSSADYAEMYNLALTSEGKSARFSDEEIQKFRDGSDPEHYPNTDWYDLAYKTGIQHRHNVSASGGNEFVKYLASVGYLYQTGVMDNAKREQFNARTNLDIVVAPKVTAHLNLAYIRNNYSDPTNSYVGGGNDQIVRQVNIMAPWIVARYSDGTYGTTSDGNPIAWLDSGQTVDRKNNNFTGVLGLDYQILPELRLTLQGAYVDNSQHYREFVKFIQYNANKKTSPASLTEFDSNWNRTNYDATLNYDKQFGLHGLKIMAGWHTESYHYRYNSGYRKTFPNNDLTDMNAGDESTQKDSGYSRDLNMISGFGRINYDFAGRYLFEANLRADASSRFAKGHRWGYFPSFSAGWRISEEPFLKDKLNWLDNLKLRVSWGQLGNQDALSDYYPYMNTYNLSAKYPMGDGLATGYYQSSYHISDISWEKSTTQGIGIDFGIFHELTGSIDFYNRKTTGIIMTVDVPAEFALGGYQDNVGSMRNRGVEIQLNYVKHFGNDWELDLAGNFAYNKNKVLSLDGSDFIKQGDYNRNAVGKPYYSYYLYRWSGKFFQSQEEADAYTAKYGNPFGQKFMAGDLVYDDTNGDGKLTSDDKVYCDHTSMPNITYGFNIGGKWKDIDVMTFWQGVDQVSRFYNDETYGYFGGDQQHPSTIWKHSWTYDPNNAKMPRIYNAHNSPSAPNRALSTFNLFNTAYLRLKTLQVGYTLPKTITQRLGLGSVRFYYAGENLLTFDDLPIDLDPEATSMRLSSYPLLRTHSFGVNISF